jgi:hypothetical protein
MQLFPVFFVDRGKARNWQAEKGLPDPAVERWSREKENISSGRTSGPLSRATSGAAELEQQTRRKALGSNVLPAETNRKIKAAMDRAKAAGRPIEKLTFKMICDIMQDKFKAPRGALNSELWCLGPEGLCGIDHPVE